MVGGIGEEFLRLLRHDMHKIRIAGAFPHSQALTDALSQQADATAAFISRNFLREEFEDHPYRKSIILQTQNFKNPRTLINQHRFEAATLFGETDAFKLHDSILKSKLLNLYAEARNYPYTSLKYHILLTCAFYYNLKNGIKWNELYLCENCPSDHPFQTIYQDETREWALLPHSRGGVAKVYPQFYLTWERRTKISFGGEHQIFEELLATIGSWTIALATVEDFLSLVA